MNIQKLRIDTRLYELRGEVGVDEIDVVEKINELVDKVNEACDGAGSSSPSGLVAEHDLARTTRSLKKT